MPAEITHHRHAVAFDVSLDRVADIPKCVARLHRLDADHQRVMGHLDQPLGFARQFACKDETRW